MKLRLMTGSAAAEIDDLLGDPWVSIPPTTTVTVPIIAVSPSGRQAPQHDLLFG